MITPFVHKNFIVDLMQEGEWDNKKKFIKDTRKFIFSIHTKIENLLYFHEARIEWNTVADNFGERYSVILHSIVMIFLVVF